MSMLLSAVHWIRTYSILLMMALFVSIVVFTYWPGRKSSIERQGQIPFKDDV